MDIAIVRQLASHGVVMAKRGWFVGDKMELQKSHQQNVGFTAVVLQVGAQEESSSGCCSLEGIVVGSQLPSSNYLVLCGCRCFGHSGRLRPDRETAEPGPLPGVR